MSISSTFYAHVFHKKVLCDDFLYFILALYFWLKDIGGKSAGKMLMKLTKGL